VPDERRQVRAERTRLECVDVLVAGGPGLVPIHRADDVLSGDRLDATEQVTGVHAVDVDGRQ
jgi:hypothetical protein